MNNLALRLSVYLPRPGLPCLARRFRVLEESGATLVETALSATILIAMLIGMMQMSLALYTYLFVSEAAREATRYAIVRGSTSCTNSPDLPHCNASSADIQNFLRTSGYPGLIANNLTATTSWLTVSSETPAIWSACSSGTCNGPGNLVNVTVKYTFPLSIPFVPSSTLTMSSTSQMVIAQ